MASEFVMIWNEGHVRMPQSWKQGQVRLILKNDKPRTIGDAQPITLPNAHHNMHSHMVGMAVERLNDHTVFFSSQSKCVGFCQSTSWQRASHTVSKERGGDYRAMASCQGVLKES